MASAAPGRLRVPGAGSAALALALFVSAGCGEPPVDVVLVQVNDVYEIGYVDGRPSTLARLAGLISSLEATGTEAVPVLAGDFLSPSALGEAPVDGERLKGRQMVDVLNRVGIRYVTLGNREFDLDREELRARQRESTFGWLAANLQGTDTGELLEGLGAWDTVRVRSPSGAELVIGLIGLTFTDVGSTADWVRAQDPLAVMREAFPALEGISDVQVALTHLPLDLDRELARAFPGLDLILGGHEHDGHDVRPGPGLARITKARANAETAWVHRLRVDPRTGALSVESEQVDLTGEGQRDIRPDSAVQRRVEEWFDRAFVAFAAVGIRPREIVGEVPQLDGRESTVRFGPSRLTGLIAQAMLRCDAGGSGSPRVALYNSGGIRVDDVLGPGTITEYDVLRVLPFGGAVVRVDVPGSVVSALLDHGRAADASGAGSFLQTSENVTGSVAAWSVDGAPLDPLARYTLVVNDFVAGGYESPGVPIDRAHPWDTIAEMRLALIGAIRGDTMLSGCLPPA